MVNKEEQLRAAVRWRAANRANSNVTSLGEVLDNLVDNKVSPLRARYESVAEAWSQLLPIELYQHCRIVDITGGRLEVSVDSSSYLYELKLLSGELLKELAHLYPRARVKEIKFTVG